METITSRKNPLCTHFRKLAASRAYREETGEFLCDSPKLLTEALARGAAVHTVVATPSVTLPPLPEGVRTVQVPEDVIKARFDRLLKEVQKISAEKAGALTGQTLPVLIEEQNEQDASLVTGRLSNNSVVHLPGTADMIGKILDVKLTECRGFYYLGERADGKGQTV